MTCSKNFKVSLTKVALKSNFSLLCRYLCIFFCKIGRGSNNWSIKALRQLVKCYAKYHGDFCCILKAPLNLVYLWWFSHICTLDRLYWRKMTTIFYLQNAVGQNDILLGKSDLFLEQHDWSFLEGVIKVSYMTFLIRFEAFTEPFLHQKWTKCHFYQ